MPMITGPISTEVAREDILALVHGEIDQIESGYPLLAPLQEEIRRRASQTVMLLPDTIKGKPTVTIACRGAADSDVHQLSHPEGKHSEERAHALSAFRNELCGQVTLLLHKEYIEKVISEIRAYQACHKPARWGIGSTKHAFMKEGKSPILFTFIAFWSNNVEKGDALFRKFIVPRLDPEWQEAYRRRNQSPHEWRDMSSEEIANTLTTLRGEKDPSKSAWHWRMTIGWKGPGEKPLGRSFYHYWTEFYREEAEAKFSEQIVPQLPESWQKNLVPVNTKGVKSPCPYTWDLLSSQETVSALLSLKSRVHPTKKRWSFWAAQDWCDKDGKKWGKSFCMYWKAKYRDRAEEEFRGQMLPLFPSEWQATYCERGRTITFIDSSPEIVEEIAREEDLERLVAIAQAGHKGAYDKALEISMEHLVEKFPGVTIPPDRIGRFIHTYRSALRGSFRGLIETAVKNFTRGSVGQQVSFDEVPWRYDTGFGIAEKGTAEDRFLDTIEPEPPTSINPSHVDSIRELGLPAEIIDILTREIASGRTLEALTESDDPQTAHVARRIATTLSQSYGL